MSEEKEYIYNFSGYEKYFIRTDECTFIPIVSYEELFLQNITIKRIFSDYDKENFDLLKFILIFVEDKYVTDYLSKLNKNSNLLKNYDNIIDVILCANEQWKENIENNDDIIKKEEYILNLVRIAYEVWNKPFTELSYSYSNDYFNMKIVSKYILEKKKLESEL